MNKLKIKRFGICSHCRKRDICDDRTETSMTCGAPFGAFRLKSEKAYRPDHAEIARQKAEVADDIKRQLVAGLKRIDPATVKVTPAGTTEWRQPDKKTRIINSREGKVVELDSTEPRTLSKWCEVCGEPFSTITPSRRLCEVCHDDICEFLGVDYSILDRGAFTSTVMRECKDLSDAVEINHYKRRAK